MENTKAKCLLIMPTKFFFPAYNTARVNYNLLTLMSHIIDLAEVKIIDLEIKFGFPKTLSAVEIFLRKVEKLFLAQRYKPDIIGISCYTSYDYLCTMDLLRLFNRIYPEAILVVGGYHPTAKPDDFVNDDIRVDYIVRGEGEIALRNIIKNGRKNLYKVIEGPELNLEEEKPLQYHLYPYQSDDIRLTFTRSCPHKCSFCVQSDNFANNYRFKDIKLVKEQVNYLVDQVKVNRIMLNDPLFGAKKSYTMEIIEFLLEKYPHLTYWAETRVETANKKLFKLLSRLKIELHIGVESLAEDTICLMNKSKNPQHYIDSFYKTAALAKENQILLKFGFIMNYPGESLKSYKTTVSHIKKIVGMYDSNFFTFSCNPYALFPGNRLYNQRFELQEKYGFIFNNDGWWREKKVNSRERSQNCIGSKELNSKYKGNQKFWYNEITGIQIKNNSKLSFKAYTYFNKVTISNFLRHYYKNSLLSSWDEHSYHEQRSLLNQYYHKLGICYHLYQEWFQKYWPYREGAFLALFNKTTIGFAHELLELFDEGIKKKELEEKINGWYMLIRKEYNETISGENKNDCIFKFRNKNYHILSDGNIKEISASLVKL